MKKIAIISLICIIIDQVIKVVVTTNLEFAHSINVINNFFRLTYLQNTGAAWSILSGNRILLVMITLIALFIIYYFFIKGKEIKKHESILYGLLLGGILGNLIDRVRFGYVIDYLDFNIFSYHYPVFNFADICIVISIIVLLIISLRDDKSENKSRKK